MPVTSEKGAQFLLSDQSIHAHNGAAKPQSAVKAKKRTLSSFECEHCMAFSSHWNSWLTGF